MSDPAMAASHEELCDQALKHYYEISTEAMHSSSLVPRAIEFYKERWGPQGERKIILSSTLGAKTKDELLNALKEGWGFDPWLNPRGNPIIIGHEGNPVFYWVLVKGSPEQIAALEPFPKLPEEEEPEPEKPLGYVAVKTEYIPYDKEGKPSRDPEDGFVIMHKDHIYAKGTVFTLLPGATEP